MIIPVQEEPNSAIQSPERGLSLRKNFSWTFLGNVIYSACQWGILVVLAKLGTAEMVGQFALGLAITAPVIMFSQMQLRGVQATDAMREYAFGDYLGLRLMTTLMAAIIIVSIVAGIGYKRETAIVILIVGTMKCVDAISDVYHGLWQRYDRMDGIAQALMLNGFVSTTAMLVLMQATHNIVIASLGTAFGSIAALSFTLSRHQRLQIAECHLEFLVWRPAVIWRLARLAIPLGFVVLLTTLSINLPRYFIQTYMQEGPLGIFVAVTYFTVVGATVVDALGQSISPRLSRLIATGQKRQYLSLLIKSALASVCLGTFGIAVTSLFGRFLLTIAYNAEFAEYQNILVWAMVAATISYVGAFLTCGLTAARQFTIQAPLAFSVTIVTLICCYFLVPRYGLLGAIWSVTVAATVRSISAMGVLPWAMNRRF